MPCRNCTGAARRAGTAPGGAACTTRCALRAAYGRGLCRFHTEERREPALNGQARAPGVPPMPSTAQEGLLNSGSSENDQHGWKRRGVLGIAEFQPTGQKANLRPIEDVIVKIFCVRPGGEKKGHKGIAFPAFFVSLLYPQADSASIRRIAKDAEPPHDCLRPSCSRVKYRAHLWFCSSAQGSRLK